MANEVLVAKERRPARIIYDPANTKGGGVVQDGDNDTSRTVNAPTALVITGMAAATNCQVQVKLAANGDWHIHTAVTGDGTSKLVVLDAPYNFVRVIRDTGTDDYVVEAQMRHNDE